jgi:hypothetical protein
VIQEIQKNQSVVRWFYWVYQQNVKEKGDALARISDFPHQENR